MQADIFDRALLRARRERAAAGFADVDYLKAEAAAIVADRLCDLAQDFPLLLDVGAHGGQLAQALSPQAGVGTVVQCDLSTAMLQQADGMRVAADEEALPFAEGVFDAVVSAGSLHWANDLAGVLTQCRRLLKPDGLLVVVMPGPETFRELRESFAAVEAKHGMLRPHLSPFPEIRDAGNLLQQCGFALPVADQSFTDVQYRKADTLLRELKQMGEANALLQRDRRFYPKGLLQEVLQHYTQHYATPEGHVQATVEWVTLTARAPDASRQQQPARRGSGRTSLSEFLH
jgi:SAM-dependent methyltransferase